MPSILLLELVHLQYGSKLLSSRLSANANCSPNPENSENYQKKISRKLQLFVFMQLNRYMR